MIITVDGLDGSGKTSSIEKLIDSLGICGFSAIHLKEPGGTPLGQHIREFHLNSSDSISPLTQLYLMMAARCEHTKLIREAEKDYQVVFIDRWLHSTFMYQYVFHKAFWDASKIEDGLEYIRDLHYDATDVEPDAMTYISTPFNVRKERLGRRGDMNALDVASLSQEMDDSGRQLAVIMNMMIFEDDSDFIHSIQRFVMRTLCELPLGTKDEQFLPSRTHRSNRR